jgi:hypothetical protein
MNEPIATVMAANPAATPIPERQPRLRAIGANKKPRVAPIGPAARAVLRSILAVSDPNGA